MGKEKFEGLISESLKKLPYRFLNKLKNVAIIALRSTKLNFRNNNWVILLAVAF